MFWWAFVMATALALSLIAGLQGAGMLPVISWMPANILAGIGKMTASCGFLGLAVSAGAFQSAYGWALFAGLFFSWWGDLFLIGHGERLFLAGLIAFFLAHVAYAVAFLVHGVRIPWVITALVLMLLPLAAVSMWLYPYLDSMKGPVFAYMGVITLMVAFAAGATGNKGTALMLVGAILFYASDLFVARGRFVHSSMWNGLIGLPLYFLAQAVLAATPKFLR